MRPLSHRFSRRAPPTNQIRSPEYTIEHCLKINDQHVYKTVNARRQRRWDAMSEEEQKHYLATTSDKGNKLLTFRFAY